jgi:hypothetical protein
VRGLTTSQQSNAVEVLAFCSSAGRGAAALCSTVIAFVIVTGRRNVCYKDPMSDAREFEILDELTYEKAVNLVGTSIWIDPEKDHRVELRIVHVGKVMESEAAQLKRAAFSIFFLGPKSYRVEQGAYPTRHEAFGEPFWLFIVPLEERADGYLYEAVFT